MIKESIAKIVDRIDLSENDAMECLTEIMSGQASESQISAYIVALRMKGETIDEVTGSAKVMRRFATSIKVSPISGNENIKIIDTCGTGGDCAHTFNISTAAAIVLASCGLIVAKHGNRSVSSSCGSADVLEALGVNISISHEIVEQCISKIGIGFLFAPSLHGAMKYAVGPRKQIGIRTIFNMLGPLTNPAGATCQVLGVYDGKIIETMANVLKNLGSQRAWIVHGDDGLDEITTTTSTQICELNSGNITVFKISPEDFGLKRSSLEDIRGGAPSVNAKIIGDLFNGVKGPCRDIVLLNAAAGLLVGDKVKTINEGIKMASEIIETGKAGEKLAALVEITNNKQ